MRPTRIRDVKMKLKLNLKAFMLVVLVVLVCSCSKEEDKNTIIGRWKVVNMSKEWFDGSGTFLNTAGEIVVGSTSFESTIEFKSDGSMTIKEGQHPAEEGRYSLQEKTLTLYFSASETVTYSIEKLTKTSLSLKNETRAQHYYFLDENGVIIGEIDDAVFVKSLELEKLDN